MCKPDLGQTMGKVSYFFLEPLLVHYNLCSTRQTIRIIGIAILILYPMQFTISIKWIPLYKLPVR